MDFETQIDNFNEEILDISRDVKELRDKIKKLYHDYKSVRFIKWSMIALSAVGVSIDIMGIIPAITFLLISTVYNRLEKDLLYEVSYLTEEYDDKIIEIVNHSQKKIGLAEVWNKSQEETVIRDEEKAIEYSENMPNDEYIMMLLIERAALELLEDEQKEEKGKSLRKIIK